MECEEQDISITNSVQVSVIESGNSSTISKLQSAKEDNTIRLRDFFQKNELCSSVIYSFVGTVCLLLWNICLNTLHSFCEIKYNSTNLVNIIIAIFQTFNLLTQSVIVYLKALTIPNLVIGLSGLSLLTLIIPFIAEYAEGKILLLIIFSVVGVFTGISTSCACGTGAASTKVCVHVAFGYGFSGILSYSLWMIFSRGIWDADTESGLKRAFMMAYIFCSVFSCIVVCSLLYFMRGFVCHKELKESQDAEYDFTRKNEDTKSSNWKKVVYDGRLHILNIMFSMLLSMLLFPNLGPLSWKGLNLNKKDIIIGMFQLADFLGRYIPIKIKISRFEQKILTTLTYCRLIYVPFYIIPYIYSDLPILCDFWFLLILMFSLGLTNGWFVTLSFSKLADSIENRNDKDIAGALGNFFMLTGIVVGLWLSKLF